VTRHDVAALAGGALVGAGVTLAVVLLWTALSRPAPFPTTVAVPPTARIAPTATPVAASASVALRLATDGLGALSFGDDGGAVLTELGTILGSSSSDERWTCTAPAADVQLVGWADLGVFIIDGVFVGYVDAIHYPPDFGPPLGLASSEGLRLGLGLDELQANYAERLELREAEGAFGTDVQKFVIDGDGGLWGMVEGGPDGWQVITISAGTTCFDNGP
jgi:hypothetical protein